MPETTMQAFSNLFPIVNYSAVAEAQTWQGLHLSIGFVGLVVKDIASFFGIDML